MIGFTKHLHEEIARLNRELAKRDAKILRLEIQNQDLRVTRHWKEEQVRNNNRPWTDNVTAGWPTGRQTHSSSRNYDYGCDSSSTRSSSCSYDSDSSGSCCYSSSCD